jgi:hypothetical protein
MARPSPLSRPGPTMQSGLGPPHPGEVITYDPTDTGLDADNIQDAIDELYDLIGTGGGISVTDGTTTVDPTTALSFDSDYFDVLSPGGDVAEVTLVEGIKDVGRWELAVIPGSPPDSLYADGDWLYIWVP